MFFTDKLLSILKEIILADYNGISRVAFLKKQQQQQQQQQYKE